MSGHYQILLPLLSLFLVRVDLTDLIPLELKVQVIQITDGDTLLIKMGNRLEKLRLARIDAPEKLQPFVLGGAAGRESQKCLQRILKPNKTYLLSIEKRDIYGRLLGDFPEISEKLISEGCAGFYPYTVFSSKKMRFHYLRLQSEARRKRRGVWAFGGYRRPNLWRKESSKRISRRQ